MNKFRTKTVLTDSNDNIILMSGQRAVITTTQGTKIEGVVRFIGDGSISFMDDNLRINYSRQIKKIEVVEE